MKFRVCFNNGFFPHYFYTKKEAVAYQQSRQEETRLEKKIGGEWFSWQ